MHAWDFYFVRQHVVISSIIFYIYKKIKQLVHHLLVQNPATKSGQKIGLRYLGPKKKSSTYFYIYKKHNKNHSYNLNEPIS